MKIGSRIGVFSRLILIPRPLEGFFTINCAAKRPGFDSYWFAMALEKVRQFPDDINQWLVEMLVKIDVLELKNSSVIGQAYLSFGETVPGRRIEI